MHKYILYPWFGPTLVYIQLCSKVLLCPIFPLLVLAYVQFSHFYSWIDHNIGGGGWQNDIVVSSCMIVSATDCSPFLQLSNSEESLNWFKNMLGGFPIYKL